MGKLSIGQAWDDTKAVFQRDGNLIAILALALMVVPGTLAALITPQPAAGQMPTVGPSTIISFVTLIIGIIGQLAVTRVALGHRETVGNAIRESARRTPAYLGANFLWLLPFLLLMGPFVMQLRANPSSPPPAASLAIIALSLVLIFLFVRLILNTPVAAAERPGVIGILKRSWSLTSGRWWRLFGFLVVFFVGLGILLAAVGAVLGAVTSLLLGPAEPMSVSALIVALGSQLAGAAMTVVLMVMLARIYLQLTGEQERLAEVFEPR